MPRPIRVLFAEDVHSMHKLYDKTLPDAYFQKRFVADGEAALLAYQAERPDVMVLDIKMPGIDGYGVAERIRKEHGDTTTAIVMATALSSFEDFEAAARHGIQGYLVKPFKPRMLQEKLISVLEETNPELAAPARLELLGE